MHTKIVKTDPVSPEQKYIQEAVNVLNKGGLVIIPTETVYGIAASSLKKNALDRLYGIKKRPKDKPFSIIINRKEKVEEFAKNIPVCAYKLIDKFWPGPLTILLESKDKGKIGLRMPDHEIALRLILLSQGPLVCPSANISGNTAPVNFPEAIKDLKNLVDFAIDAGQTKIGRESSIVDLTVDPLQVVRAAAIKKEELQQTAQRKIVLFVCTGNSCRSVMAKALLEKKLQEKKRSDIEVLSAGVMLFGGLSASEPTKEVLRDYGVDVSGHVSQGVSKNMIRKSDLILVMEKIQEERVLELVPEAKNRLFLLKEFARIDDANLNIADPIGRDKDFYKKTCETIKQAVDRVAEVV